MAVGQSDDGFAGRLPLVGTGISAISNNSAASREAGEPVHAGFAGNRSLWWSWTAVASGPVQVSLFGSAGGGENAALAVYAGASLGGLTEVASSNSEDDDLTPSSAIGIVPTGPVVEWMATAGTTYQIAADANSEARGLVALNLHQPPTLVSEVAAEASVGREFAYSIQASNRPITYAATGLPPGLSVNPFSGGIDGAPTVTGTFPVTLTATNVAGSGTAVLTLTVREAAPTLLTRPVALGAAADRAFVGESYSYAISGYSSVMNYAVTGLPPGLSFDPTNGWIDGTLTTPGVFPIGLALTNAAGTSTAVLTLTVEAAPEPPPFTHSAVATATLGGTFIFRLTTGRSYPTERPARFSAEGLPPGLILDTRDGTIRGTPTAVGTFPVAISATNAGGTRTATLTITVAPMAPAAALAFTADSVWRLAVGSAFNYPISVSGNPTGFTASNLPPGLSLNPANGYITGTPLVAGTFIVPLTVTDGSTTVPATLTLLVEPTATPISPGLPTTTQSAAITSSAQALGYVGQSFSYALTVNAYYSFYGVSYAAGNLPPGLSLDSTTGLLTGTPTAAGSYAVPVSVAGEGFASTSITASAVVTIVIAAAPPAPGVAPMITSPASASGAVGATFTYTTSVAGTASSFAASGLPADLAINSSTGAITGTPQSAGTYPVTLSATNAAGTRSAQVTFFIAAAGPVPVITSDVAITRTVGSSFSYSIFASNSPTAYGAENLPPGLSLNTANGQISGTPTTAGTWSVPLMATNAAGTGNAFVKITITPLAPPQFTSSAVSQLTVGQSFSRTLSASNSPTSYTAGALPAGLTFDPTAHKISGTPTAAGTFQIPITATNTAGTGTATLTLVIAAAPAAPLFTCEATASGVVGSSFTFYLNATNSPTSYSATNLPPGLTHNAGGITGTPISAGTTSVPVTATNAGGTAEAILTIVIAASAAPAEPPVITSSAGASEVLGGSFSYTITASNSPTSYGASGLPAGLSVNTATGAITGTPGASGTFDIALSATNATGTANATLTLAVTTTPTAAPLIRGSAGAAGFANEPFYYPFAATNAPTSYSASNLPAGLSLNPTTGVISGAPTATGTFVVPLAATNAAGTGSASLRLTIVPGSAMPRITSKAAANGVAGAAFSYTITASRTASSYGASGYPAGLTFNSSTGVFSGAPTTAGTYQVSVSAFTAGGTASATVTFTVTAAASAIPEIASAAGWNGYVGGPLFYQTTASGSPTAFSATGLPAGCAIDAATGLITGTPMSSGTFTATLSATNAAGTGTGRLTIRVSSNPPAPHFSTSATVGGPVGAAFSHQLKTVPNASYFYPTTTTLPAGLQMSSSGLITGTPSAAGEFPVSCQASTSIATVTCVTRFVFTTPTAATPVIKGPAGAVGYVVADFLYAIAAANLPTSFAATNLPAGLTFDAANGVIRGQPQATGTFLIGLSATNSIGTGTATLTLQVRATPPPPVIKSGLMAGGVVGVRGVVYQLKATNGPSQFTAANLPPGLTLDAISGAISGTPATPGAYAVNVTASNTGGTASATVTLVIAAAPAAPVISGDLIREGFVGAPLLIYNSASNSPVSYAASGLPPGVTLDSATGEFYGTPTTAGEFDVDFSATNAGGTGTARIAFKISAALPAPTIIADAAASGTVGKPLSYYSFYGSTPSSGSSFDFIYGASGLPPGLSLDVYSTTVAGTPTAAGSYAVTFSVQNGGTISTAQALFIIAPSEQPQITSAAGVLGFAGAPLSYAISGGTAPTAFGAANLPPGLALSGGTIVGLPTTPGEYAATISFTDAAGTASATVRFVVLAAGDAPPVITSPAGAVFDPYRDRFSFGPTLFTSFSYKITAINGPTSFAAGTLPAGLSLNPHSGVISGTPAVAGTFTVPISATNSAGTAQAVLTINSEIPVLGFQAPLNVSGFVGWPFNLDAEMYFHPYSTLIVRYAASGLPPGLSLNTATGAISGTSLAAGIFPVTLTTTTDAGASAEVVTFLIREPIAEVRAPAIVSAAAMARGAVGVPLSYNFWADAAPTSFDASGLPPGLSLSIGNGVLNGVVTPFAQITGTPTAAGTFAVQLSAANAQGSTSAIATLVIAAAPAAPVIASDASASGRVGAGFSYLIYTDYDAVTAATPKSYAAANLPPGLTLNAATGQVTGIPTLQGSFVVPISATVAGVTGSATLTLEIEPAQALTTGPAISGQAGALGFVGVPFTYSISALRGANLSASPLPPEFGFKVTDFTSNGVAGKLGTISGIPGAAGTFTVPVASANEHGTATTTVTVTIVAPQLALPVIAPEPVPQTVMEGGSVNFHAGATGVPGPSLQWQRDGTDIPGATGATLTISAASVLHAGSYRVIAANAAGSVASEPAALIVQRTFETWQTATFTPAEIAAGQTAPTADFNRDGILNLMEYALTRDPRTGAGALPVVALAPDGERLQIQFMRDTRNTDLTYVVETSTDLLTWTPIARSALGAATVNLGGAASVSETVGTPRSVVVRDGVSLSAGPHRFIRLNVTQP